MNIEQMNIDELIEYKNNPRNNEKAVQSIADSIKEFGFKNPIILDKNNVIIAGHTRLKASKLLGLSVVPVIKAIDLTDEQVKAFRIADNKTSELAEWNLEKLQLEMAELEEIFTGFDKDEFQEVIGLENLVEEDEFEADGVLPPKTKFGEIYELGEHRMMVGDSTSAEQVQKLMDYELADLVVTDPPYNVNYEGQDGMKIENDNMNDAQFVQFLTNTFKAMNGSLKEGGAYYIWHSDSNRLAFSQALEYNGIKERQNLIWVKSSMVLGRQDYQWKHEPCLYGWKPGASHYFINDFTNTTILEDKPNLNVMGKEELKEYAKELERQLVQGSTIIREDKPHSSDLHPTMKPVRLVGHQILNSSKRNERVLDLFGGSGSTLIACEQLNRKAYVMELEPKYADVIIKRWEEYTGEKAVKL